MHTEKERLVKLLNENKISADDYKLLLAAIDKKPSQTKAFFLLLINPFQKIAGTKSLIIGLMLIVGMSALGVIAKFYFHTITGIIPTVYVANPKIPYGVLPLLYQNLVAWLILSILFFLVAKIFRQKKTRIIDFIGTVAASRYPYFIFTTLVCIVQLINPELLKIDISQCHNEHLSPALDILQRFFDFCAIWQVIVYFFALKESSGLEGKRLWIGFIFAMFVGSLVTEKLALLVM